MGPRHRASPPASQRYDLDPADAKGGFVPARGTEPPAGFLASRSMKTAIKDTNLVSDLAKELSVPLFHGTATTQAWLAGEARGMADKEYWALMEHFEELAGFRERPPGL